MCGLIAVFNSNASATKRLEDFVKDALIASAVRGSDSTGLFNITGPKHSVLYHKLAVNGTTFVQDRAVVNMIEAADNKCITVGHVRKATQGAVNINNAHPFFSENDENGDYVIGVHNGSLLDWRTKPNASKYEVDSEWAINHIAARGMDAFKDFKGPYAFIWYDSRTPDVINVARNNDRTLYYQWLGEGKDKDGNQLRTGTVIMASEGGMLAWLAARNNLPVGGKIFIIEAGQHYAFNIKDVTLFTKKELPAPPITVVTPAPSYPRYTSYADERKQELNKELRSIFRKVAAEETKKEENVPHIGEPLPTSLCLPAEVERAVYHKELGESYQFLPDHYDDVNKEVVGELVYNFGGNTGNPADDILENLPAVLRGVPQSEIKRVTGGTYRMITASVIGIQDSADSSDIVYILGSPRYFLKPMHNLPAMTMPMSSMN